MSAIAGIYHFNGEPVPLEHSGGMMKVLQKYPADDVQVWQKNNLFLGCHAQWITPESVGERLPYYDHERKCAITADAIIDNRDELFEKLQVKKADRKQMSDSELILLSYYKWEDESPKYLIGDFAFMIWDERKHILFGARDFSGSRTLYYYRNGRQFAFCTVIMPLFSLPYIEKQLNEQWLAGFLALPGISDEIDLDSTVYQNIIQLPPAHTISVEGSSVTLSRYCTLTSEKKLKLKSNQEYEEAFREVFQNAVTAQSRTRHHVGARLSGGLDSGAVASFAARALRQKNKQLHTYSYVPEESFIDWTPKSRMADESPYIKSTVQYVGNIQDHYLDFAGKSPLTEVSDLLETLEMPYKFFENSFWLNGIYEKASQEGIGVLLNGGRGNYTISWGSALDYYALLLKKLNWFRLYREAQKYSINKGTGRKRILQLVGKRAFPIINRLKPSKDDYHFPLLIHPNLAKRTGVFDKIQSQGFDVSDATTPNVYDARKKQFSQINSWSLNGTSRTKLSLRYALWDRDPTNDLRVVKFCLSVPEKQYVQNGLDRALIRRSTKNYLPDKVRLNQRIRGIQGADGVHRMKNSWKPFIEELEQLNTDSAMTDILNKEVIKSAILKLREELRPDYVYDDEFKVLMRSLIVYRFIKKFS